MSSLVKLSLFVMLILAVGAGPMVYDHGEMMDDTVHAEVLDSHSHEDAESHRASKDVNGHFHLSALVDHLHDAWMAQSDVKGPSCDSCVADLGNAIKQPPSTSPTRIDKPPQALS